MPHEMPLAHPLTYVRESLLQMGVRRFADHLCRHGKKLGHNLATNRTTVWKWETWGQVPDRAAQAVIADMLGIPPEYARPDTWPLWLPVWEVTGIHQPWTQAGTVEVLSDLVRGGHMDRRGFLTITGASLSALAVSWAEAPAAFASAAEGDRVTDRMLTSLEQRVTSLRDLDAEAGGAKLLEHARSDLALITTMIKSARCTETVRARLHSLAAEVAHLTGWMAYDSGLHSVGQQYYVAALRSARTAGDEDLGAFVLAEMGVHASDGGYNRERATLLETALERRTGSLSALSRTYLYLHLAAAKAQLKDHRGASVALQRSLGLWDRVEKERPAWLGWFGESQIDSTRGKVALWAGRPAEATRYLVSSVTASAPRDRAVRAGRLAEARLTGHDLDGALDAATHGVKLLEGGVASGRAVDRLKEFSGRLKRYDTPAVRDFQDRLRALPVVEAA